MSDQPEAAVAEDVNGVLKDNLFEKAFEILADFQDGRLTEFKSFGCNELIRGKEKRLVMHLEACGIRIEVYKTK